jgi:hypothetical protein
MTDGQVALMAAVIALQGKDSVSGDRIELILRWAKAFESWLEGH